MNLTDQEQKYVVMCPRCGVFQDNTGGERIYCPYCQQYFDNPHPRPQVEKATGA